MNRTLLFAVAAFIAVVGFGLLGADTSPAVAGHCCGCHSYSACYGCYGGCYGGSGCHGYASYGCHGYTSYGCHGCHGYQRGHHQAPSGGAPSLNGPPAGGPPAGEPPAPEAHRRRPFGYRTVSFQR